MDGEGHSFVENCKQLYCKLITIILQFLMEWCIKAL